MRLLYRDGHDGQNINYVIRKNQNSIRRLYLYLGQMNWPPMVGWLGWFIRLVSWYNRSIRYRSSRKFTYESQTSRTHASFREWQGPVPGDYLVIKSSTGERERLLGLGCGPWHDLKPSRSQTRLSQEQEAIDFIQSVPSHFYILFFSSSLGSWKELLLSFFLFVLADVLLACEIWKKKEKKRNEECVCVSMLEVERIERGGSSHRSGRLFFFYPVVRSCVSGFLDGKRKGESSSFFPSLCHTTTPELFLFSSSPSFFILDYTRYRRLDRIVGSSARSS